MTDRLYAGVAEVDITPWAGVPLAGDIGRYRPANLVLDPLHARALVLRRGERTLGIVALETCMICLPFTQQVRAAAQARLGIPPEALMLHAIQTHTAPGIGAFMLDEDFPPPPPGKEWLAGGDDAYDAMAVGRILEALERAANDLRPVQLGAGSGIEGRFAFNRRAVLRDGSIGMPWKGWQGGALGPTDIAFIEGPMDPEVGVVCLRTDDLQPRALLLNYACHPVHVFPKILVSADWPGAWSTAMQARFGADCVPLVLNGPCGNLNPWPPFDPDYVEDHRVMGQALAAMTGKVLETMTFTDAADLDWRTEILPIPFRDFDMAAVARAKAHIEAGYPWTDATQTAVEMNWMFDASLYSAYLQAQREGVFSYEIQTLRLGDIAIVGLPGEPFIEAALRLKLASPARRTYVVHLTNQYVGYIPTREALPRGGHECNHRYWSKLAPAALDLIVDKAAEMVQELFGEQAAG